MCLHSHSILFIYFLPLCAPHHQNHHHHHHYHRHHDHHYHYYHHHHHIIIIGLSVIKSQLKICNYQQVKCSKTNNGPCSVSYNLYTLLLAPRYNMQCLRNEQQLCHTHKRLRLSVITHIRCINSFIPSTWLVTQCLGQKLSTRQPNL